MANETVDLGRSNVTLTETDQPLRRRPPLERGAAIGRYLVLDLIGEGGMGVVARAYDPKLHREIALKRLHRGALDSDAEARLMREAQAMAQLSHPNVITIHDVERTDDGVVLAMEYVEGQTLAEWIEAGPHPYAEVLDRFGQAGQGLLAAHRAGLVHRDFKPSNAIIGRDGRVKVMDFGLARAEAEVEVVAPAEGDEAAATADRKPARRRRESDDAALLVSASSSDRGVETSGSLSDQLTRAGAVMGTPLYMAPEQHRGEVADARSDQYAFCVSLWEGLFGKRPFRGQLPAIVVAKHEGPPAVPKGSKVPRPILEALRRGLQPTPGDRFESMEALLDALGRDPHARRRIALRSTGVAALVLGAAGLWWATTPEPQAPCEGAAAELEPVWGSPQREAITQALAATALSYAETTAERVNANLDEYAREWTAMHQEACEATAVHKTQSEAMLDLRMQCLRRRKLALQATAEVLGEADAKVAETAIQQAMGLPPIERCGDLEALAAAVPPPESPQVAEAVEDVRDELVRLKAISEAGQYEQALKAVEELLERAEGLGYSPLHAELLARKAHLVNQLGDFEEAASLFVRAYEIATRVGATETASDAASSLVYVTGNRLARLEAAKTWATTALALAQRLDPGGSREAMALNAIGVITFRDGDFKGASDLFEQALPMLVRARGEQHEEVATTLNHLGAMLDEQGRFNEAEPHFRRALEIQLEVFGEGHPRTTVSMDNLALCLQAQGRHREALALHEEALKVRLSALDERHPDTGLTHNNLGWDYMGLRDAKTAAEHFAAALSIFEEKYGPDHPRVAMAAESLALAQAQLEDFEQAEALHRRALEIRKAALGDDHPNVALSLNGLATAAFGQKKVAEAIALHRQALAIMEANGEGAERYLADILSGLGLALLTDGQWVEAQEALQRALDVRGEGGTDPVVTGRVRFRLAKAKWGEGRDRAAARTEIEDVRAGLETIDNEGAAAVLEDIDAWLADNPAP